ncbi:MAG: hypothetical protein KME10_11690 [Plectolyngbya sp. WJT66-NPBG17]|jgi:hypothetical protein|nr:hypothetical protein [Plectolyngbya sp. WJT66-NPBG17]
MDSDVREIDPNWDVETIVDRICTAIQNSLSWLKEFWMAQDIRVWITESKRLAELNANLRKAD